MGGKQTAPVRRRDRDIVLDRDDEGRVYASMPHAVHQYGVDGFDWGCIGLATAELALNILNWMLPPGVDGEAAIRCERGECSAIAWRLHRSFMAEFLVRIPYAGGCIQEADVCRWVQRHFDQRNDAAAWSITEFGLGDPDPDVDPDADSGTAGSANQRPKRPAE